MRSLPLLLALLLGASLFAGGTAAQSRAGASQSSAVQHPAAPEVRNVAAAQTPQAAAPAPASAWLTPVAAFASGLGLGWLATQSGIASLTIAALLGVLAGAVVYVLLRTFSARRPELSYALEESVPAPRPKRDPPPVQPQPRPQDPKRPEPQSRPQPRARPETAPAAQSASAAAQTPSQARPAAPQAAPPAPQSAAAPAAPQPAAAPVAPQPAASPQPAAEPAAPQPAAAPAATRTPIPPDFDSAAFIRQAKLSFIRLQDANDRGDLATLREVTTERMFDAILAELRPHSPVQHTDVVSLDASLLELTTQDGTHSASVRFHGMVREGDREAAPFEQVWHLQKPVSGTSGWVLAGIQQVS